jgi:alkylation response protein AidB-like acyl-CoA dehydrogenase
VLVAAPIPPGPGGIRFRAHFAPKTAVDLKPESWDVLGLRATASVDYVVEDLFVPTHRTYEYAFSPGGGRVGTSAAELAQLNALGLSAFASGVGLRALDELLAFAKTTKRTAGEGVLADDNVVQFGIGEIEGRMRAARTQVLDVAAQMDTRAAEGGVFGRDIGLEAMQATQTLARASRDMVVFAFDNAPTAAVYRRHPLQRCLRDIFTGLKHAAFTPQMLGRIGKVRLGLDYGGPAF